MKLLLSLFASFALFCRAEIAVNLSNDMIFGGTDKNFSNGTQVSYSTKDRDYFLLQNIYTPEDISAEHKIENDRPYAGLLVLGVDFKKERSDHLITDRAILGVLGPSSQAEWSQNTIHSLRGIQTAEGWKNQESDKPVFLMGREIYVPLREGVFQVGHSLNLEAGNLFSGVGYSIPVKVGYNVPSRLNNRIRVEGINDLSFGLEWTPAIQYVAYDATLHGVDKEEFYGEYSFGVFLNYKKFGIGLYRVEKTDKFEGQGGGERFGAISFKF